MAGQQPSVLAINFTDWECERCYFDGGVTSCLLIRSSYTKDIEAQFGAVNVVPLVEG